MIIMGGGGAVDSFGGGLLSVSAKGGKRATGQRTRPREIHHTPTRLPDGSVLFAIRNEEGNNHLGRFRPETRTWADLAIPGEKAWWLQGGFLVVAGPSSFEAYRFDLASGQVMGRPVDVLPGAGEETLAIASTGTAVYIGQVVGGGGSVVAVDDQGAATPLPIGPGSYRWPRASPDGTRLAIGVRDVDENDERLWVYELDSGRRTSLGPGPCGDFRTEPIWSPDSLQLVTSGGGDCGLLIQRADGSQPPTVLFEPDFAPWPTDWSRDGKQIAFYGNSSGDDNQSIWLLDLEPELSARPAIGGAGPQRSLPSHQTADGWPTLPGRAVVPRSTCSRCPNSTNDGPYLRLAASIPSGRQTARRSTTVMKTKSTPWPSRLNPSSNRELRGFSSPAPSHTTRMATKAGTSCRTVASCSFSLMSRHAVTYALSSISLKRFSEPW